MPHFQVANIIKRGWKWIAWSVVGILGITAAFGGSIPLLSKQFWRDLVRPDVRFEVSYILDSFGVGLADQKINLEIKNHGRSKLFMPFRLSCYPEMPFEAPNAPAFIYLTLDGAPEVPIGPSLTPFSYRIENRPSYLELAPISLDNFGELTPRTDSSEIILRDTAVLQYFCSFLIGDEESSESSFPLYLKFFGVHASSGDENADVVIFGISEVSLFIQ